MATIPRAELNAIAARYNDHFDIDGDPTVEYARWTADYYRSAAALIGDPRGQDTLRAEADELEALADRYEWKVTA